MYWLIIFLIIVLLIITAMLPFTISGESSRHSGTLAGNFAVHWLILQVIYDFREKQAEMFLGRYRIFKKKEKPAKKQPEVKDKVAKAEKKFLKVDKTAKKRKKPVKRRNAKLPDVKYIRLAAPFFRLIKDIIRAVHFNYLKIHTIYGLEDPAYTGILTGFIQALYNSFAPQHDISFDPDFTDQVLDWDVKTSFEIVPAMMLLPMTRFVTNRRVIAAGWRIIRD